MGIYIKGMEMPKCCNDCWALDDDGDYPRCRITQEQRGYNFNTKERKMAKCPLINVQEPHGRLIDADACIDYIRNNNQHAWETLAYAPIVIEGSDNE